MEKAKSYVDWINKQQEGSKQKEIAKQRSQRKGQFKLREYRLFTPKTAGKTGKGHGGYFTEGKKNILTGKPISAKRGARVSRMTMGGYEWLSKRRSALTGSKWGMTPMMPPNEINLQERDIKMFDIDNQNKRKMKVAKYNFFRRLRSAIPDPQKRSDMLKPLGKKTMRGGGKSGGGGGGKWGRMFKGRGGSPWNLLKSNKNF